jgi:hypothetical protein
MLTAPSSFPSLSVPEMDAKLIASTVFRYNYMVPSDALSLEIRGWAFSQGKLYHELVTRYDWTWCVYRHVAHFYSHLHLGSTLKYQGSASWRRAGDMEFEVCQSWLFGR